MVRQSLMFVALAGILLTSCSISKSARDQRNLFSGTWNLDNISYENNSGNFKSVLFNDAEDLCFQDSEWFFRDNNSTGRYTLKQSSLCQGGDRFFRWSVVEPEANYTSQLQFQPFDDRRKDISGGFGYRLNIVEINEQTRILPSTVSVEGQAVTVAYRFSRK